MESPRNQPPTSRRAFGKNSIGLAALAGLGVGGTSLPAVASNREVNPADDKPADAKAGRLNQSLCKWCYDKNLTLDELCQNAQQMGLSGIDLLGPKDFDTLKKYGLVCTMVTSHKLTDGLCEPKFWDEAFESLEKSIEAASLAGFRNVICFSGNARGIDRKTGMKNCAEALRKIAPVAEKKMSSSTWSFSTAVSTTPTTCAIYQPGASNCANRSLATISNCSTTSTTCRSWKETSFAPSKTTTSISAITTPEAIQAATKSTSPKKSTTHRLPKPSPIPDLTATSHTSFSPPEMQ